MANKTRVQVRGTIGKSVKIPVAGVTQAQLAAAIAAIPASTSTTTASAAPSSGVTSVGLSAASSDIVITGTTPITASGAWTVDVSATVKTDLGLAATSIQPGNADLALAATAIQPGGIQNMESAGWNSTSGAIQLSLVVAQDILIPYTATLREVDVLTQGAGSCTVTLTKCAIGGFPGSLADITNGHAQTFTSNATQVVAATLASQGWTTAFSQNDVVRITLTANIGFTSVKVILRMY